MTGMKVGRGVMAGVLALTLSSVAGASILELQMSGVIQGPGSAHVGDWMQVGPLGPNDDPADHFPWGTIDLYTVSVESGFPTVGNDLDKYGWAMIGTIDSIDDHVITYSGESYILAPGYGFDTIDEYLEKFTWTMTATFVSDWSTATIVGTVYPEAGARQPPGWPVPVDWSSIPHAWLEGTFDGNTQTFSATIIVVPEPATAGLIALGAIGLLRRRGQRRSV